MDFLSKEDSNGTLIDFIKNRKKQFNGNSDEGSTQKQQILEELHVSHTNCSILIATFLVFNSQHINTDLLQFFSHFIFLIFFNNRFVYSDEEAVIYS